MIPIQDVDALWNVIQNDLNDLVRMMETVKSSLSSTAVPNEEQKR